MQLFLVLCSRTTLRCLVWSCSSAQVLKAVTSSSITCRRSSLTLRYCRCSCRLEMSSLQRSLSTAPPTRVNASVSPFMASSGSVKGHSFGNCAANSPAGYFSSPHPPPILSWLHLRFCEFWQPLQRSDRHTGHERLSDRHEETEGAAKEAQGCQQALLKEVSYPDTCDP